MPMERRMQTEGRRSGVADQALSVGKVHRPNSLNTPKWRRTRELIQRLYYSPSTSFRATVTPVVLVPIPTAVVVMAMVTAAVTVMVVMVRVAMAARTVTTNRP